MLAGLGFAIALYSTPDNGKNQSTRLAYLIGFAFASGEQYFAEVYHILITFFAF